MARLKIRDFRRNELIDATIASIAELGLSDTTLSTIAAQAGVSPGLVNHYFEGKDELLEITLRRLAKDLALTIRNLMPTEPSPLDRLHAIIDGCLTVENFRPDALLAWLHFWMQVPNNPRFARLQQAINRRFRSNILYALNNLIPHAHAEEVAVGLYALIDGFWLRQAIDPDAVRLELARTVCRGYLTMVLACQSDSTILQSVKRRSRKKSAK